MDLHALQNRIREHSKRAKPMKLSNPQEQEILARTVKLNEEVGELCNDILSVLELQRKSKLEKFDKRNFYEEFGDVIITTVQLANAAGVDIQRAVNDKMKKLKIGTTKTINAMDTNSFQRIYNVVKTIPAGKVMTYGQVARMANVATPRVVGFALHANKDPLNIPCHRVVFSDGSLTKGYVFGGEGEQQRKLREEGVHFLPSGKVDKRDIVVV